MGPKIIIICGVDGTGKTFIVNKLIKEFEKIGQSVRFNTFKKRREDNDKYKIPKKGIEWEFRKEVVEQINRRMEEHDNEDWLILDKSPYSEYFYQQTPSFDRGYITRYENHLLEKEVFRNKRIIDESIVIFLENEKCWENYKGREYSKKDQGHKTSYPLLDEERYMEMVKSFKECQDIYEGEKYANIKISNNDTDWERVYNKIIELDGNKPPIEVKNVEIKDNIRVTDGKKYIEKNGKNIRIIEDFEKMGALYLAHSHELSAHMGIKSTYDNLKDKYYWENMLNDVERYVRTCDECQRRGKPQGKNELHPIKVVEPWYQIGIDFVGPLNTTTNGNKYIIVAMDYFTKWPEAKAVKEATAKEVSKFIYEDIICRHGCPMKILSDRGSHFNNEMIKELMEKFKIKWNFSTSYHPETNGLVERFNQTLGQALAKLSTKDDWDQRIAPILFAYRNKKHSSTRIRPFYLTYGRNVRTIMDENIKEINLSDRIVGLLEELPKIRHEAKEQILKSQTKQKEYHDRKIIKEHTFGIGDKILLYDKAKAQQLSGKLESKWLGPFYIHEILPNGAYRIKNIKGVIKKIPVNGELLKTYHTPMSK
ncbi:putative integrase core domain protein [Rhizophagus irregularis DAOM 181602=DAOM 197198]|nr:putative integrase core domain protein [Rhizophagus irregularis DAOM 181602=DAOM 197198]